MPDLGLRFSTLRIQAQGFEFQDYTPEGPYSLGVIGKQSTYVYPTMRSGLTVWVKRNDSAGTAD